MKNIIKPSTISPNSDQNNFINQTLNLLNLSNLKPQELTYREYISEIEFTLLNQDKLPYSVIFSTKKNPLGQITALQKLIKIANIKGIDIKFIDLSSNRPYATL